MGLHDSTAIPFYKVREEETYLRFDDYTSSFSVEVTALFVVTNNDTISKTPCNALLTQLTEMALLLGPRGQTPLEYGMIPYIGLLRYC